MYTRSSPLVIKKGTELTESESKQMVSALYHEFKLDTDPHSFDDKLFFLYKASEEVVAMAGLWEVKPVMFDGKSYVIHGVVEVIATMKGRGYGSIVMRAMHEHMSKNNLTGIGFCRPAISEFYEKCGFTVVRGVTHRFIFQKDGKDITNQDGQIIFCQDGSDEFMKHVLSDETKNVLLPTDGLW